jgi:transcriptional regulator with XRE-family HTH domain
MDYRNMKELRVGLGISQAHLAQHSELSLATIQNIENGIANPSISTLENLLSQLGCKLDITQIPADLDLLSICGLPFEAEKKTNRKISEKEFLSELRRLSSQTDPAKSNRVSEALSILLFVIFDEYPKFAKRHLSGSSIKRHLPKKLSGRLLKLRHISRARISKIL